MLYTFDQIFAADPANPERVASNGVVTIFAPGDTTQAPIEIKTVDGLTITNPVQVNDAGYGPAFTHDTLDRVAWSGGGFSGFFTSYDGIKNEAVAARVSAQESAAAAEEAVANTSIPTSESVRRELETDGAPANQAIKNLVATAAVGFAVKPDNGGKPVGKGELMVNIGDYGAVGDGVTEDQPAFQAAMDYLMAQGGGTLLLQRGMKYRVGKSVQCADNTTIVGNGATVCKKDATDWQYAIFQTRQGAGIGYGAGLKNFTVRDVNFTANFTLGRSACAFAGHHAQNVLFENCVFHEFQGQGHSFDLAGCDGVTIKNCEWRGFDNTHGASADGECIQIDNSLNGALSNTEAVGSYDGLPTINVTVSNCKFLPLVVGGKIYPCPNPLGAHSRKEGAWHTNIIFENNLVVDPVADTKSAFRGTVHLIASDGVRITGNTWRVTPGKTAQSSRAIGLYAFDKGEGTNIDPNINSGAPLNPISPMTCKNIKIEGNTFIGFNNTGEDGNAINLVGLPTAKIEDVTIRDNTFRDMTGGVPAAVEQYADCVYASHVDGLEMDGNYARKCKRTLVANNCADVRVAGGASYDSSFSAFYLNACSNVELYGMTIVRASSASLLFSITGLLVDKLKAREPRYATSPQAMSIRDSTSFMVTNCILNRSTAVAGSTGISVYGTSTTGSVRNNVITGYGTKADTAASGGNITVVDNL